MGEGRGEGECAPKVVTQIFNLSVSPEIAARRDDFAERGSVSRSVLKAIDALDLPKRWAAGNAPAGHRPALHLLAALPRYAVSPN